MKRTRRAFFLATRPFVTVLSLLLSLSFSFLAFSSLTSLRRGEARACLSRLLRIFFAGEVIVESVKPAVAVAGRVGPSADLFSPAERSAVTCDDFSRRARETFFLLEDGEETRTRGRPGDLGDFEFSGEAGEDAGGLRARGRRFFRGTHPATTLLRSIFFDVLTASDDAFCGVRLPEFRDAFLFAMFSELILECQEPVRRRAVVCVELQVRDWCPRVCHALLLRGKTSRYVRVRSAVVCRALLANEWAAQLSRKRQKANQNCQSGQFSERSNVYEYSVIKFATSEAAESGLGETPQTPNQTKRESSVEPKTNASYRTQSACNL